MGSQTTVQGYVNFGKWGTGSPYNGLYNITNDLGNSAMFQVYFKSDAPAAYNLYGNSLTFYSYGTTDPNIQNEGTTYTPTINMAITNGNIYNPYRILNINSATALGTGVVTISGANRTVTVNAGNRERRLRTR
jgi:hypothetical protein